MQAIATVTNSSSTSILGNAWQKMKGLLLISSVLGLVSMNILSLVNETVHDVGYGIIKAVLASTVSEAVASRLLKSSPTVSRKNDVGVVTKALNAEKSAIYASKKALEARHILLEKSHQDIKVKHADLTRTSAARTAVTQKISKRLATRAFTNATRNSTSVFAEAIPVVGVAVVLSVTAWDLYDSCETLKDLNELNLAHDQTTEDQTKVCGIKLPSQAEIAAQIKANGKVIYQQAMDALKKLGAANNPIAP